MVSWTKVQAQSKKETLNVQSGESVDDRLACLHEMKFIADDHDALRANVALDNGPRSVHLIRQSYL